MEFIREGKGEHGENLGKITVEKAAYGDLEKEAARSLMKDEHAPDMKPGIISIKDDRKSIFPFEISAAAK